MDFSICVDAVFGGKDVSTALEIVKKLGFKHFEFWSWWDKDLDTLCGKKDELGLQVAALCTKFVSLVDPEVRPAYLAGLEQTIDVARHLGCGRIISQVGDELSGVSREEQHRSLVEGLKESASAVEKAGLTLVFEPLNTLFDHPGYYLYSSSEAFAIAAEVGSEHVKVIYDIYHQQVMEGNLIYNIVSHIEAIGHFHAAGHPGRHELDRGEINYAEVFRAIESTPYQGCVGLEYFPEKAPEEWLPKFLERFNPGTREP